MRATRHEGIRRATLFAAGLLGVAGAFAEPSGLSKDRLGDRRESLQEQAAKAVRVRLISESAVLTPGKTNWLALDFAIGEGWHLYWHNAGDSGMPISFRFTAPEGVRIGEAVWPTPERHVSAGIILDYIYEGGATILFPVEVDASVSGPVTVSAAVEWLVCREACVPGGATATGTFDIGSSAAPGADAARFESARKRVPTPVDPADRGKVEARFNGTTLIISAPRAEALVFYPYASDAALPADAIAQGEAKGDRMSVEFAESVLGEREVRGVVEVRRSGQAPEFWLISVDPGSGS